MIIHDCVQGTSEWLRARAGIPTASSFHKIITKSGGASDQKTKYRDHLIAERLMGHPIEERKFAWTERGHDLEAEAIAYYEGQRNLDTVAVGFITNDAGTIGASPDRLVGDDGLVEIKVPAPATHVHYLLDGSVYAEYKPQAQGQLWITERKWVDICSYHPEMPKAIVRVTRDEEFIRKLAKAVTAFSDELEEIIAECERKGWLPDTERQEMLDSLTRNLRASLKSDPEELVFE